MDFVLNALDHDSTEALAVTVVGLSKLMLSGMLRDDRVSDDSWTVDMI